MTKPRVVILGGYGTFGRLVADQLIRADAQVVIAGRDVNKGQAIAASLETGFVQCDAARRDSLSAATTGAHLVINAAGPFQARDYSIPQTCIEQGCHYIDLGDGRDYVAGIGQLHEMARDRKVFVCVGASTTPAVTSAVVTELSTHFQRIRSIKVALTAGNRNPAGVSTIASILAYVGAPVRVWQDGQWQSITGWGLGEFIDYPPPVGRRRVQLCDVPDLELFPELFQAESVVFKAGVELTLLNYAIGMVACLRKLRPSLNLPALAKPMVWMSKLFKKFGTLSGSVGVWVTSDSGQQRSLAFVAPANGPRVPTAAAVLLARKLLGSGVREYGAFACVGFVSLAEFAEYLAPFGIFVVRGENGVWACAEERA